MKKVVLNYRQSEFDISIEGETAYDVIYDFEQMLKSAPLAPKSTPVLGPEVDADFKEVGEK